MNVHQEGAVGPPENVRGQRFFHFLERAVIRAAFEVARYHRDHTAVDGRKNHVLGVNQQEPLLRADQHLDRG